MRTRTDYRPWLSDCLEARSMPSVAVLAPSATRVDLPLPVTLPPQVHVDSLQVQAAFVAFDRAYEAAIESVLLAPRSNGAVNPSANRAAFNASVLVALNTLADDLVETADVTNSAPSVATGVVDAIVGNSPNSLESRLLALPTAAIEPLTTSAPTSFGINLASSASLATPVPLTTSLAAGADRVSPTPLIPIPQGLAPAIREGFGPTSAPATDAPQEVRKAFGDFLDDYFHAVQGVLLANQGGAVDPKAARDAFDARVGRALQWLGDGLYVSLRRDPAVSGLAPQVREAIEGDGPSSLKARLKGLPTPDGPQAAIVREFTMGSVKIVADMLSTIAGDVSGALKPR